MKAALFYYEIDIFSIYLREQYEVCRVMYTFWSSYVPTFCILLMVIARGWGILGSWQCVNYRTGRSSGLHVHPSSKSCLLPLANSQPFFKVSSATQSQSTLFYSHRTATDLYMTLSTNIFTFVLLVSLMYQTTSCNRVETVSDISLLSPLSNSGSGINERFSNCETK